MTGARSHAKLHTVTNKLLLFSYLQACIAVKLERAVAAAITAECTPQLQRMQSSVRRTRSIQISVVSQAMFVAQ